MTTDISVSVVCKVNKSQKTGESYDSLVRFLVHCQKCQFRQFLEDGFSIKKFSPAIECCCEESDTSLSSKVVLGPMWAGSIFRDDFVEKIVLIGKEIKVTGGFGKILQNILIESRCFIDSAQEKLLLKELGNNGTKHGENKDNEESNDLSYEPPSTKTCSKSYIESEMCLDPAAFYMDFQVHSITRSCPPKLQKIIDILRSKGFKATKNHFGGRCVRTNASLHTFRKILLSIHENS